jgi:hypothetical protein
MKSLHPRRKTTATPVILALILTTFSIAFLLDGGSVTATAPQAALTISGQVTEFNGTPVPNVTITLTLNRTGTFETKTTQTDANGNYLYEDAGCANSVRVEPSKAGLTFTPQWKTFVSSSNVCGSQTANFTVVPTVVISQLYTGGGDAGATFRNDFVELFNRGGSSVSLAGWSVQHKSPTGATWQLANLAPVTLAPGQHYLLQMASGGPAGAILPTPDSASGIAMSSTGGQVVLLSNNTLIPSGPPCPIVSGVVDLVGYGDGISCFEVNPAPAPANTNADLRVGNGCQDTDNNGADFVSDTPNPRNTAAIATPCGSSVQFSGSTLTPTETPNATTKVEITVTRSGDLSGVATVNYATSDQTASERSDYLTALGTLRFESGQASKTITVFIVDDSFGETAETFNVTLSDPVGSSLITPVVFTVTINSNEAINGPNPVRDASFNSDFFVREHYVDFFNREADASGLAFWKNQIDECTTQECREIRRINVSAAFSLSIEFQQTGYLVYKANQAAFNSGEQLKLRSFLADTQEIGRGVIIGQPGADQQLETNKQKFFLDFVQRPAFLAPTAYPTTLTAAQFVDKLNGNTFDPRNPGAGALTQGERDSLVTQLAPDPTSPTLRAQVLRSVSENGLFTDRQFNKAFVLMQYFGYLRRNPNDAPEPGLNFDGYNFWLNKLNQFEGNFVNAEMVKSFIVSGEYIQRFGP